jgi:hypothetical protein
MNSNTSTFIGLGALGTLIAYFGYQYLDEDDNNVEEKDNNTIKNIDNESSINKMKIDDTSSSTSDLSGNIQDISKNKIKLEVQEQITKKIIEHKNNESDNKKETNKWSNYWEDQYNEIDKKQDIVVE